MEFYVSESKEDVLMEDLILEYKKDLKALRKQHQQILSKRYRVPITKNGRVVHQLIDERTPQDIADQKVIAEAISTTEYALFWLETGREKPFDEEQAKKIPKHRRAVKVADIDVMSYQVYLQNVEKPVEEIVSPKKKEMLIQLREVKSLLSSKELALFQLIHVDLCTYGEAAKKMGIAVGTVKSMSQRIKNKIDHYFEYGHQIDLFEIC